MGAKIARSIAGLVLLVSAACSGSSSSSRIRFSPAADAEEAFKLEAKGWGNARFVIDSRNPPDLQSSRISVQATEIACAGGQAPANRQVQGVVLKENERRVSIVIFVEPTKGAASCPGNPAFPFAVQLGSPLGDREVFDASAHPPAQRWPLAPDAGFS